MTQHTGLSAILTLNGSQGLELSVPQNVSPFFAFGFLFFLKQLERWFSFQKPCRAVHNHP